MCGSEGYIDPVALKRIGLERVHKNHKFAWEQDGYTTPYVPTSWYLKAVCDALR